MSLIFRVWELVDVAMFDSVWFGIAGLVVVGILAVIYDDE
jgi:hypothetical protein